MRCTIRKKTRQQAAAGKREELSRNMEHEIYVSREVTGLGHNESAGYIKKR